MWNQVYDPFNNSVLSTVFAALPVVTLLVSHHYHLVGAQQGCLLEFVRFSLF
jgi:hypothetical protein